MTDFQDRDTPVMFSGISMVRYTSYREFLIVHAEAYRQGSPPSVPVATKSRSCLLLHFCFADSHFLSDVVPIASGSGMCGRLWLST